jgi:hypothetical protein
VLMYNLLSRALAPFHAASIIDRIPLYYFYPYFLSHEIRFRKQRGQSAPVMTFDLCIVNSNIIPGSKENFVSKNQSKSYSHFSRIDSTDNQ